MTEPYWQWCPMPGAARRTALRVDQIDFGDGYIHRLTRGLNPALPTWSLQFPFVDLATLQAMDTFLTNHAAAGFYFTPPDDNVERFVVCNEWNATVVDRTGAGAKVGQFTADFVRCFNPQPAVSP